MDSEQPIERDSNSQPIKRKTSSVYSGSQPVERKTSSVSSSPHSPEVRVLEKKQEQRIISDNLATGNAIQFNGDLIDAIKKIIYNNVFISNTFMLCVTQRARLEDGITNRAIGSSSGTPRRNAMPIASPNRPTLSPPLYAARPASRPRRSSSMTRGGDIHLTTISVKLCGITAMAIYVPEVKGNWVSSKFLEKTERQPKRTKDWATREGFFRTRFKSTGEYLVLNCHRDESRGPCSHHFYITEEADNFEVLLGTDLQISGATTAGLPGRGASNSRPAGEKDLDYDTKVTSWMNKWAGLPI